jgi:hypothetical protein
MINLWLIFLLCYFSLYLYKVHLSLILWDSLIQSLVQLCLTIVLRRLVYLLLSFKIKGKGRNFGEAVDKRTLKNDQKSNNEIYFHPWLYIGVGGGYLWKSFVNLLILGANFPWRGDGTQLNLVRWTIASYAWTFFLQNRWYKINK